MNQGTRWLQQADSLLRAGQLQKAEALCRRALQAEPESEPALMLLGTLLLQQAKKAEAVECYLKAAALDPTSAGAQTALGMAAHVQGQFAQAASYFQLALDLDPDAEETRLLLNNTLLALGHLPEPTQPAAQTPLLNPTLKNPPGAYSRTKPPALPAQVRNAAEREFDLGVELLKEKQFAGAEAKFQKAVELRPNYPDALNNLGVTLRMLGRLEESVTVYRNALRLRSDSPQVYENLGLSLQMLYRFDAAEEALFKARQLHPNDPLIHRNLGVLYLAQNRCEEAEASFRRSLELNPESAETRMNLGIALLKKGDFAQGWAEYEARLRIQAGVMDTLAPRWDGKPLEGRTILLFAEQGLGDAIQYARFAPLVKARGGRVALVCQAGLKPLFTTLDGVDELVEGTRTGAATLPPFAVQASLLSLPGLLGIRPDTLPAAVPYLHPEPEKRRYWQERLASYTSFKIGIVWAGNPAYGADRERSCSLSDFSPLFSLPGVRWFSLQKRAQGAKAEDLSKFPELTDLSPEQNDFTDTAAMIANLDLVISVDTSVTHLAGALGARAWTLLAYSADWRWMLDRTDTPWYPTMRLFRQPRPADWASVFAEVTSALPEILRSGLQDRS